MSISFLAMLDILTLMKVIMTPDYGLSDIWHFNYPLKNFLSESLKSGKFPLWTDMVGNGFPVAAEGQIGAFSPINWLIFGLLPMPLAFMVALLGSFLITAIGSFLFARSLKLSKSASVLAAAFAAFNGYFIAQMTHLNLLQSYSFIPWAFWLTDRFIYTKSKKYVFWLGMILGQMILVGYPQTFFNTVIMLGVYIFVRLFFIVISTDPDPPVGGEGERRNLAKRSGITILFLGTAAVGAIFLAAVQVLPLVELVGQSDTIAAAANQRFIHPLTLKHLLTVFNPFIFGDPSRGTYPVYGENWGMFWENMFYVGIVPILAILLAIVKRKMSEKKTIGLLLVLFVSLLLSLGKYSPLSILFKLPPLSFTRISSRFLVFSNVFLGLIAASILSKVLHNKKSAGKILIILAILHVIQVIATFRNYHLIVDANRWLETPSIAKLIPFGSRIISFGQSGRWNKTFLSEGWWGKEDEYYQNRNSLDQNSNMIFGIRQLGVYAQQLPKMQEMIQRNMYADGTLGRNIRDIFGVTHIVDAGDGEFKIIENTVVLPDIRVSQNIIKVRDSAEALGRMNQETFSPANDVLWESEVLPGVDEEVVIVNRSFYPGWKAFLLNKQIQIYPVNINQQAVIVPENTDISTLSFRYDPASYKIGGVISIVSLIGWIFAIRYLS